MHNRLLLLLLAAGLTACENDVNEVRALGIKKPSIEEAREVTSFMSTDGVVRAKLTAPLMLRYLADSPRIEFPRTLQVLFYTPTMTVESQLNARYARYLENDSKVLLQDSVVIVNFTRGDTLNTNELWWDQNAQLFYTDKPVLVRQAGGQRIPAQHGLRADQSFKNITFNQVGNAKLLVADSSLPN